MAQRKVIVTLELTVRDMTQAEWDDANEGAMNDPDDEFNKPEGWVASLDGTELNVPIEGALSSIDNPEMFAGSSLFIVTENALVTGLTMLPVEA